MNLHSDLFGTRERKYEELLLGKFEGIEWQTLNPKEPQFLFSPQNEETRDEYEKSWKLPEILSENGDPAPGVVTTQDEFAISFSSQDAIKKVKQLLATKSEKEARELFTLCSQSQWNYERAKIELGTGGWKGDVVQIQYRPFDSRWTVYNSNVAVHRRDRVMRHMLAGENLALISARSNKSPTPDHFYCTRKIMETKCGESTTQSAIFPLYLYKVYSGQISFSEFQSTDSERRPNLSPKFLTETSNKLHLTFISDGTGDLRKTFGPEDVFHYMYAVFHSPAYRGRYAEFLKMDFPRLPFTSNVELFRQLCGLGEELVALHLLEASALNKPITKFKGKGDNIVAKGHPKYQDGVVLVNASQGFEGVPEDVWEFHIGGYQVCHKWLKDRRERELSAVDIVHYQKVVVALKETILLMGEVDEVINVHGGWPMR